MTIQPGKLSSIELSIRTATLSDIKQLEHLMVLSVRGLFSQHYSAEQVESALEFVFGIDSDLIHAGRFYIAEVGEQSVACGGWSVGGALLGGDTVDVSAIDVLGIQAQKSSAVIRAFFVRPDFAGLGIAKQLINQCEKDATHAGFTRFELFATLTGEGFYRRSGYNVEEYVDFALPNGVCLRGVQMSRSIPQSVKLGIAGGEDRSSEPRREML